MKLTIRDVPQEDWYVAVKVAKTFLSDYPLRGEGFHNSVFYMREDTKSAYMVYKTKTQLVVRKS